MPTLLRPWKRPRPEEPQQPHADPEPQAQTRPEGDRFFLLTKEKGGLSYHLSRFADEEAANDHLRRHALEAQGGFIAFWGLHDPEAPLPESAEGKVEPVVLIRDPLRAGSVQLYSFIDMTTAQAFVRSEVKAGLDPGLVMVYWAATVGLEAPSLLDAPPLAPEPRPAAPMVLRPATAGAAAGVGRAPACAPDTWRTEAKAAPRGERAAGRRTSPGLLARMQVWPGWDGLGPMLARAVFLNEEVYENLRRDPYAAGRARLVLGTALTAAAVGAAGTGMASVVAHVPAAVLGWIAYVFTVYFVGTRVFPGGRDEGVLRRMLPALGLATAPAMLLALGAVPVYGPMFVITANIWVMLTTTAAITPVLGLDRQSALVTATVACLVMFAIAQVLPVVVA